VFPYQPEGIWNLPYNGDRWVQSEGGDRHRRGLYTFLRRSSPYPTFNLFDAPARELCCTRRARSNTPLQALALLNDPTFVEASVALARRMLELAGDDRAKLALGFRACTSRRPDERESSVLADLLRDERERWAADADAARKLASSQGGDGGLEPDPRELAAWISIAGVLLNLDETITRG
jgi:hypothetical protein